MLSNVSKQQVQHFNLWSAYLLRDFASNPELETSPPGKPVIIRVLSCFRSPPPSNRWTSYPPSSVRAYIHNAVTFRSSLARCNGYRFDRHHHSAHIRCYHLVSLHMMISCFNLPGRHSLEVINAADEVLRLGLGQFAKYVVYLAHIIPIHRQYSLSIPVH